MEYEPLMRGSMPEEEVFPLKGEAALAPAKSPKLKRRAVAGALLGLSVGALAAVAATRQSTKSAAPTAFGETTSTQERYYTLLPAEKGALAGLAVSNKYIASDRTRPDSYPWLGESEVILEPFRDTTFSMLMIGNLIGSKASDSYEWKITRPPKMQNKYELDLKAYRRRVLESKGMSKEEIDELEPEYDDGVVFSKTVTMDVVSSHSNTRFPVVHAFDELGLHVVSVTDTSTGESVSAKVHVKYVRQGDAEGGQRGPRGAVRRVEGIDGDERHGGRRDLQASTSCARPLSTEHNNLAGDRLCDHLHDGMGFVPGHLQVTRLLEASLQSVDSSVALPYWEYTIDVENIIANNDGHFQAWRDIPAFTNEWFGKTDIKSGFVREGHFKDMSLEGNEFTTVSNSWGLIRAPWNNLKNPRFARFFGGERPRRGARHHGERRPDEHVRSRRRNVAQ